MEFPRRGLPQTSGGEETVLSSPVIRQKGSKLGDSLRNEMIFFQCGWRGRQAESQTHLPQTKIQSQVKRLRYFKLYQLEGRCGYWSGFHFVKGRKHDVCRIVPVCAANSIKALFGIHRWPGRDNTHSAFFFLQIPSSQFLLGSNNPSRADPSLRANR